MATSILAKSKQNKAEFKARMLDKYDRADKKKLLKRAALVGAGAAAAGGLAYGGYKARGGISRGASNVATVARAVPGATAARAGSAMKAAKSGASRAKFASMRAKVRVKKRVAPKFMRGNKGLSWFKKGMKKEDFDFTRDELIEAIMIELIED